MPPTKLFAKFLSVAIFTFQVNCSGTVKFSLDFEEFKVRLELQNRGIN